MTLADVAVKRAYFWRGGSKRRSELGREGDSKRQTETENPKKREM